MGQGAGGRQDQTYFMTLHLELHNIDFDWQSSDSLHFVGMLILFKSFLGILPLDIQDCFCVIWFSMFMLVHLFDSSSRSTLWKIPVHTTTLHSCGSWDNLKNGIYKLSCSFYNHIFSCYALFKWIWTYKVMTSHHQFLLWEKIDKSQGVPYPSCCNYFPLCPSWQVLIAWLFPSLFLESAHADSPWLWPFCSTVWAHLLAVPWKYPRAPSLASFNGLIVFQSLSLDLLCLNPHPRMAHGQFVFNPLCFEWISFVGCPRISQQVKKCNSSLLSTFPHGIPGSFCNLEKSGYRDHSSPLLFPRVNQGPQKKALTG